MQAPTRYARYSSNQGLIPSRRVFLQPYSEKIELRARSNGFRGVSTQVDSYGWTPLHYAAKGNQPECVRILLAADTDPNQLSIYSITSTPFLHPLHVAAREGSFEALCALMKSPRIMVNHIRDGTDITALHYAAMATATPHADDIVRERELAGRANRLHPCHGSGRAEGK